MNATRPTTAPELVALAAQSHAHGLPVGPYLDQLRQMWPGWTCSEAAFVGKLAARQASTCQASLVLVPITVEQMQAHHVHLAATLGATTGAFKIINGKDPASARKYQAIFRIDANPGGL